MHTGEVVSLHVIVDVSFPVAVHDVIFATEESKPLEVKLFSLPRKGAKRFQQWVRLGIQIHKHKSSPLGDLNLLEREIFMPEIANAFHLRGIQQTAIKTVGPSVIETAEDFARAASFGGRTSAMTTDVVIPA